MCNESQFQLMMKEYHDYKASFGVSYEYSEYSEFSSIYPHRKYLKPGEVCIIIFALGSIKDSYDSTDIIEVYFRTPTYDIVDKDVRTTLEMKLSAIGGTMGLLTGFSFLSAIEFVYFFFKFVLQSCNLRGKVNV